MWITVILYVYCDSEDSSDDGDELVVKLRGVAWTWKIPHTITLDLAKTAIKRCLVTKLRKE